MASTKAFVAQTTALLLFTLLLARQRGLKPGLEEEIVGQLHKLPDTIAALLKLDEPIAKLAEVFADKEARALPWARSFFPHRDGGCS